MKYFLTALAAGIAAALVTIGTIGILRMALEFTRSGDELVQRSCGKGAFEGYCVERHHLPGIPLLRNERHTVEVYSAADPARHWYTSDPFWSDVTITWSDTGATLADSTGVTLLLDRSVMDGLSN